MYSLPEHIHPHIEIIMPTWLFGHIDSASSMHQKLTSRASSFSPSLLRSLGSPTSDDLPKLKGPVPQPFVSVSGLDTCDQFITPDCLRALYNIDYKPVSTNKNTFGIGQYRKFYPVYIIKSHHPRSGVYPSSVPSAGSRPLFSKFLDYPKTERTDIGFD